MFKSLVVLLCICTAINTVKISQGLQFSWAYDRLCGSTQAPFMWTTADPARLKTQVASPVFWQAYTIFPQSQPGVYQGGVNCNAGVSCKPTGEAQTVVWSYNNTITFTGKPAVVNTVFSWDNTDPTKLDDKFSAYLATLDQSIPLWPKHSGYNRDFTTYILNTVWGLGPENSYFEYLKKIYPSKEPAFESVITFRQKIAYGAQEPKGNMLVQAPGNVLTGSTFEMNIGDGPIVDNIKDVPTYFDLGSSKGYWSLANGRVKLNDVIVGSKEVNGFGTTCFSNYWHNSVIAVMKPTDLKAQFAMAICGGVYTDCKQTPMSLDKLPSLYLTLLNSTDTYDLSKDYEGYQIEIKPEDYVYGTTGTDGTFTFVELLIGDLSKAVYSNACPGDSTLGIGNLFHIKNNINYVHTQKLDAKSAPTLSFKIGVVSPTMTKVTVKGKAFKNLVVWLGLISVALFFFAILICKAMSPKLEKGDDFGKAPHATIGNSEGEFAKDEEEDSA
jgi:hypothetical protein